MAEIVGIVASLVGPAIELGKRIVLPIKRQFNYLCCLRSNICELEEEETKLENARAGLQMQLATAENNAQLILPEVKTWLGKANDQLQVNIHGIKSEIKNIKSGCLAVKSRYSLSRKVKKMTEAVKQLRDGCNFDVISQPTPPLSLAPPPSRDTREFESRKHIEEGTMRILRDEKVKKMGICGMGGVGKTTMAKKIMNRAREENLFDETVMVAVSQQVDMLRIQGELAEKLGLKLEDISLESRAHKLHTRLTGEKKILIVVDDVWQYLKLEELGIPCEETETGSKCTTLLTSRDKGVLVNMKAQPICEIQTLFETEAWSLFTEKVGVNCVDDQSLLPIAREVANQCKGLPIALVNVAMVLEGKKDKSIWEDALEQLKSANPEDLPRILEEVYNPIKLSYDFLESPHAKSIFLLCCLFPEDYDIPLEYLTAYAMGLRMFERIRNLNQARNRTCSLVEMLKSRFLLLEDEDGSKDHVKMHDVVRDVAIYIASKEKRIECSECTWLSSLIGDQRINELSTGSTFPNLRLLMIDDAADKELEINDNSFEKMKELNVLSVKYGSFRSLPQTTQLLENLRTLVLSSCESLTTISVVGRLVNLEILICRYCRSIEELPIEIGRLRRLKLLEFSDCKKLITIAPGVMSNLAGLEELKMVRIFDKWEAEANAALSELQFLSSLTNLVIEVEDCSLAAAQIQLPPKIVIFDIRIGHHWVSRYTPTGPENRMILDLPREITLANWIHECVRSVEYMHLRGDGSSNLNLGQTQNMRWLSLEWCSTVKKLINITKSSIANNCLLQQLERLEIEDCEKMEQVFLWDDENSNKKDIGEESRHIKIIFPKLKVLTLQDLPNLTTFCKGIESIEFPLLSEMRISNCPKLESLASSSTGNDNQSSSGGNSHDDDNHSLHLICKPEKVAFGSLKKFKFKKSDYNSSRLWCDQIPINLFTGLEKMSIYDCNNIRSLFSSSIVRNLVNLKCLKIKRCKKMVKVIEDEEEEEEEEEEKLDACDGQSRIHLFPKLRELCLGSLPKLKSFSEWRCALELPSLEKVIIRFCPKIERLCLGSLTTPNLDPEEIDISPEDTDSDDDLDFEITDKEREDLVRDFNDTKDLNAFLQPVFFIFKKVIEKRKRKREEEEDHKDKEEEEEEKREEKEEGEREEDQNQEKGEIVEEEN